MLRPLLAAPNPLAVCAEWILSGLPARYPRARFAVSQGGIGWVAMLVDRLAEQAERAGPHVELVRGAPGVHPCDLLWRNFWFTTAGDPSTIDTRTVIGVDHLTTGVGYPRAHSTWPDTHAMIARAWHHVPDDELAKMTHANARHLFRWPLP